MSERTNGDLITASFNYYTAKDPPAQDEVTLLTGNSDKLGPFNVQVRSIRGYEDRFTINSHGFQILKNSSSLLSPAQPDGAVDFHDSGLIKSKYWPEITALLKESFGARVAAAMNITVRDVVTLDTGSFDPTNPRAKHAMSFAPFFVVHGDYTAEGARAHLRAVAPTFFEGLGSAPYITPEERETFFKLHSEVVAAQDAAMKEAGVDDARWDGSNYAGPRWGMFSVWRPLSTVRRHPLAIMNPRDLGPFVELNRVYRSRPGFAEEYKTTNLFARGPKGKRHRWYYLPEQKVDEVYAIKLFDSDSQKKNGPVFGAPHSAFDIEGTNHLPARRSIECRAIVIW